MNLETFVPIPKEDFVSVVNVAISQRVLDAFSPYFVKIQIVLFQHMREERGGKAIVPSYMLASW